MRLAWLVFHAVARKTRIETEIGLQVDKVAAFHTLANNPAKKGGCLGHCCLFIISSGQLLV